MKTVKKNITKINNNTSGIYFINSSSITIILVLKKFLLVKKILKFKTLNVRVI